MTLPAFDMGWRGEEKASPSICILEVRDRAKPDGEPIARLFVERIETVRQLEGIVYEASIALHYHGIEPKHSHRTPAEGVFRAKYWRGTGDGPGSVHLVSDALFLDPDWLQGHRVGTYLMHAIVTWAQRWPDATVMPISLVAGQGAGGNRARRNTLYERLGLVFDYSDAEGREGRSRPMPVSQLTPVVSWRANIRERDPREFLSELLYERGRMLGDAATRESALQSLAAREREFRGHPVRSAARIVWDRLAAVAVPGLVVLALAVMAWVRYWPR